MAFILKLRNVLLVSVLALILMVSTACGTVTQATQPAPNRAQYTQIERGNTATGQDYGAWVVQTAKGLVQDAYVRDNNKLGVVITQQVQPREVKPLARSLAEGFRKNFPNRDLTVLMYAPDKQLILTARYDDQSRQIQYQ
jgi:hypothetical protein